MTNRDLCYDLCAVTTLEAEDIHHDDDNDDGLSDKDGWDEHDSDDLCNNDGDQEDNDDHTYITQEEIVETTEEVVTEEFSEYHEYHEYSNFE
jgi:hypothetical protein